MASKNKQKEKSNRERILDLQYYFGEDANEWIDEKQIIKDKVVDTWRKKPLTYPPHFCNKCEEYWTYGIGARRKKILTYLKRSIFSGLPMERKICNNCL